MYSVTVELHYREADNLNKISTVERTITCPTKSAAYEYITYYCLHFGMCDVKMISEGEHNETQSNNQI